MLRRISPALVVVCAALVMPATSLAQATRTWVSGTGDDANPCSRTAPCKTFAGAFSKTAVGGEIDALDPAGYGALTITHAITIDGGGGQVASVLVSGTPGITVAAGASDQVIIRNLRINGLGPSALSTNGINFISGKSLRLENVNIFGFTDNGVRDASGTAGSSLVVSDSTMSDNSGNGVLVAPPAGVAAQATLENDALENDGCGFASGAFGDNTNFGSNCGTPSSGSSSGKVISSITSTSLSSNGGTGVLSNGSPSTVYLSNDTVFGNATGLAPINGGSIVAVGGTNAVYGNGSDGNPSSTTGGGANAGSGVQGAVGPQGSAGTSGTAGPRGLVGAQGPAGKVVLVTCKTVTKKVKLRHHKSKTTKVQSCTAKPLTGPVTFTIAGHLARATLARDGTVYATGQLGFAGDAVRGYLRSARRLRPNRYVLTLWRGRHAISRRTVRLG